VTATVRLYDGSMDTLMSSGGEDHRAMLVTDGYEHSPSHSNVSQVRWNEARGPGYPPGGVSVEVKTHWCTEKHGIGFLSGFRFNAGANGRVAARGAVYHRARDGALLANIDFGEDIVASGGGLFSLTDTRMPLDESEPSQCVWRDCTSRLSQAQQQWMSISFQGYIDIHHGPLCPEHANELLGLLEDRR
jgi:hypothetical protein